MLILLDIDGVMVPAKGWKVPEILDDGFPAFSSNAIIALKQLIAQRAIIILTTSHKANFSIAEWIKIFERRDLIINNIESLPKNTNHLTRKDEIINWFNQNKPKEKFVIIDDDASLNDLPKHLKAQWVKTIAHIGLTEKHLGIIATLI